MLTFLHWKACWRCTKRETLINRWYKRILGHWNRAENLIFLNKNVYFLPSQTEPFFTNPSLQRQLYDPLVLLHAELTTVLHGSTFAAHSSISERQNYKWLLWTLYGLILRVLILYELSAANIKIYNIHGTHTKTVINLYGFQVIETKWRI